MAEKFCRAGWIGTTSKRVVRRKQETSAGALSDSAGLGLFGNSENDNSWEGMCLLSVFYHLMETKLDYEIRLPIHPWAYFHFTTIIQLRALY